MAPTKKSRRVVVEEPTDDQDFVPSDPSKGVSKKSRKDQEDTKIVKRTRKSVKDVGDMDASEFKGLDDREHIYTRPDMVLGSDRRMTREVYIYDINLGKMIKAETDMPQAVEKMSDEVIVNASDNSARSIKKGVKPGSIEIYVDEKVFSVKNYGIPFTIAKCKEPGYENLWIPEFTLGVAKTSSNYGEEVHEGGKNGYGAKATNVMSTEFEVQIYNSFREKSYYQKWTDNMLHKTKPVIEAYDGKVSSTQITYTCDFKRFKMDCYDETMIGLFARHAADLSYTTKNKVIFNNTVFKAQKPQDYGRLYFGNNVDYSMVFYQWPPNTEIVELDDGTQVAKDGITKPILEILLVDTPGEGNVISFANGIMTKDHGIHVNVAYELLRPILKIVNEAETPFAKKKKAQKTDDKKKKKEKPKVQLDIRSVKEHVSILVSAWVKNASFDSQSKNQLQACDTKLKVKAEESQLTKIKKWRLTKALQANLKAKKLIELAKKTDGKKISDIDEGKGDDANEAGGPNSEECTLCLCEGDSAKGLVQHIISISKGDKDYYGVYPLRGKFLNVDNADEDRILNNEELKYIKGYLGLTEGMDYTIDANFKTLRYGRIWLFPDADVDGKHIAGLILLLFATLYPSLLQRQNFIYIWTSPIIETKLGKKRNFFYTETEYKNWAQDPAVSKHVAFYTKGLGGRDKKLVDKYDSPSRRIKALIYNQGSPRAVKMAFSNQLRKPRKEWINTWDAERSEEIIANLSYKSIEDYPEGRLIREPIPIFINNEVKEYGNAAINRCLPDMDGLKPSQKKLLYGARKRFNVGAIGKKYGAHIKSAQFCTSVAEITKYHHGEIILYPIMVLMGQDLIGSNNIPLFDIKGDSGNRFSNGKKYCASRYTHVRPHKYVPYLFREEDELIYDFNIEENKPTEPKRFYPIMPIGLLNGAEGIGVGYSHFNGAYNPHDLGSYIIKYIDGEEVGFLNPWYHGFKGDIKVVYTKTKKPRKETDKNETEPEAESESDIEIDSDEELVEVEEEELEKKSNTKRHKIKQDLSKHKLSMIVQGKFRVRRDKKIHISEIPFRTSCDKYKKTYLKELKRNKFFRSFRDNCKDDGTISYTITGYSEKFGGEPDHKKLHLVDQIGISNLVFIGDDSRAHTFPNVEEYFKAWIDDRLIKYEERRVKMIEKWKQEIEKKQQRIRFINGVLDKKITLTKRGKNAKQNILKQMEALKIEKDILKTTTSIQFTGEHIEKLTVEIQKIMDKVNDYENITANNLWKRELQTFLDVLPKSYLRKTKDTEEETQSDKEHSEEVKAETKRKGRARTSLRRVDGDEESDDSEPEKKTKKKTKKNPDSDTSDDKKEKRKRRVVINEGDEE